MKKCCNKSLGLLILRLLVGGIFLYHGITKISGMEQMIPFIGGAAEAIGLTFLSAGTWFWIVTISELLIGASFIFGVFMHITSILIVIIMFVAMNTMGRAWMRIEMLFILFTMGIAFFVSGPGRYSVAARYKNSFGGSCCGSNAMGCCNTMSAEKVLQKVAAPVAKPVKKTTFKKKK